MAGGIPIATQPLEGGFLTGRKLIFPIALVTSLFFLWGFSYGLLDVLNKHFQEVLGITRYDLVIGSSVLPSAYVLTAFVQTSIDRSPGCLLRWWLSLLLSNCR